MYGQDELPLEGIDAPRGALHAAVAAMIAELERHGRLTPEHLPLVALLYRLAHALEVSGGRGSSTALLSAQFQSAWEKLSATPAPELAVDGDDEFAVSNVVALVPVAPPDDVADVADDVAESSSPASSS